MKKITLIVLAVLLACLPTFVLAEPGVHETPLEWLESAWQSALTSAEKAGMSVEEWLNGAFNDARTAGSAAVAGIKDAITDGGKGYDPSVVENAIEAAREVGITSWEWVKSKLEVAEQSAKEAGVSIEEWFASVAKCASEAAETAGKDVNTWLSDAVEQAKQEGQSMWDWFDENVLAPAKGN